jgi:3-phenylpropionate/trans-cinnamate dioxygenase ferredoxin subunit
MFGKKQVSWYLLFSSEQKAIENLPLNKVIAIEVGGKELCIVRHSEGYFVTNNKCPHQSLPLSRGGFCENGHIVCPFHRYSWETKTGRETRRNEGNMEIYPVKVNEEGFFIGIEERKGWFG